MSILTGNNLVAVEPFTLFILEQFTPPFSQQIIYAIDIQ